MQARKQHQKYAGLQFKYYGPFDGSGAAAFCREMNGANKTVGFGTYNGGNDNER